MRYTDNYSNHDDRVLLVDDTDEDATELLTVICDGNPRSNRGFDFDVIRAMEAAHDGDTAHHHPEARHRRADGGTETGPLCAPAWRPQLRLPAP